MADSALPVINSGSFSTDTTTSLERIQLDQIKTDEQLQQEQARVDQAKVDQAKQDPSGNQPKANLQPDADKTNQQISSAPIGLSADSVAEPNINIGQTKSVSGEERKIAQATPAARENDFVPIDLTPVKLPERTSTFSGFDSYKASALYRLPGRMFFNATVENSLRFELNTFQTNRHYMSDMVYRVLPNISLGYALDKNTRVSANYFYFRDQYTLRNDQLSRNIHSIGGRIDRDIKINDRTNCTLGFMPRVLFLNTTHAPQYLYNDLLPSAVVSRRVGQSGLVYGSVMGQVRWHGILSGFQEFDQFYSFGAVQRKGPWNFLFDTTLDTNFGSRRLRRGPNNQVIIMTMEAGRRISPRYPVIAFVRAEPIFNMGANHTPGYSGFNFRIYGGIRAEVAKPPIFPIKLKQG